MRCKQFIVPCLLLFLLLSLCGCGEQTNTAEQYPIYDLTAQETLEIETLTDVCVWEDHFYVLGETADGSAALVCYSVLDGSQTVTSLPEDLDAAHVAVAPDGGVWLGTEEEIVSLSENGQVTTEFTVPDSLVDLAAGTDGTLYAVYETAVAAYDLTGTLLCQYDAPEDYEIGEAAILRSGQLACQAASRSSYSMGPVLLLEDEGLTACSTLVGEDDTLINEYHLLCDDAETALYMPVAIQGDSTSPANLGVIVYGLEMETGTSVPLFDTAGLGLTGAIRAVICDGDDYHLLYESETEAGTQCFVAALAKTEAQKQILTIARVNENYGDITQAVMAFNVSSREYYIENVYYTGDNAEFRLRMDLSEGSAPDILPLANVGYEALAHAGALADLTPYLEADTTLLENLHSGIIEAVRWEDGSLYHIPAAYTIYAAYTTPALAPETGFNWSTETLRQNLSDCPNGSVMGNMSARDKLTIMLSYDLRQFLDLESLTCQLDGEEFQTYMELMKEVCTREYTAEGGNILNGVQFTTLRQFKEFCMTYGDGVVLCGFPADSGTGVFASTKQSFAIVKNTGHEDSAWEFIKFLLGDTYQSAVSDFPVRNDCLQSRVAQAQEGFDGGDADLDDSLVAQIARGEASASDASIQTALEGLTEEEAEEFLNLVAQIDLVQTSSMSTEISIIYEEVVPYFRGEKTLEAVCDIMQDRMSTYLSEQE